VDLVYAVFIKQDIKIGKKSKAISKTKNYVSGHTILQLSDAEKLSVIVSWVKSLCDVSCLSFCENTVCLPKSKWCPKVRSN
jgi:hypothetical protein